MPQEQDRRGAPPADEQDDLAEAQALLHDPAQVAAVDTQKFGKRLSEILLQALRRNRDKMKR